MAHGVFSNRGREREKETAHTVLLQLPLLRIIVEQIITVIGKQSNFTAFIHDK